VNARKVIEMGEGTLLVSLPKDWTRRSGVKKGATLAVEELSGRKLLVRPLEEESGSPSEFTVEYPGEGLVQVTNDVTGAYLMGYDVIRISGRKVIPREDRTRLKATIGRLVGLEIMDEDSKRITVQFLLEPSVIVPEKIVRRMSGLIDGMLRDTGEGLLKGDERLLGLVGERDDEVDRLYFLLVRATRVAVLHPEVAERHGLSPVDVLDYRVLATFLESAGDAVTELSRKLALVSGQRRLAKEYRSCVAVLTEMNELATRAFISRRADKPRTLNSRVGSLMEELRAQVGAMGRSPEGAGDSELLVALERVGRLLVDVSDLAVTTQPLQ
jgi:phosphate uptake regulator